MINRIKSKESVFVSFSNKTDWAEFELIFNVGNKKKKPVKLQAHMTWHTSGVPPMFSGLYSSLSAISEAEYFLSSQIKEYGGELHPRTSELITFLEAEYGYESQNKRE